MKHYQLRLRTIRNSREAKLIELVEFEREVVKFLDGQNIQNHIGSMFNYLNEQQATLAAIQFGDNIRLIEIK